MNRSDMTLAQKIALKVFEPQDAQGLIEHHPQALEQFAALLAECCAQLVDVNLSREVAARKIRDMFKAPA